VGRDPFASAVFRFLLGLPDFCGLQERCARHTLRCRLADVAGVTDSCGTGLVSSDGQRKERTDPESAAGRREFFALEPPATGVLRTPARERFAPRSCWRPNAEKLMRRTHHPACTRGVAFTALEASSRNLQPSGSHANVLAGFGWTSGRTPWRRSLPAGSPRSEKRIWGACQNSGVVLIAELALPASCFWPKRKISLTRPRRACPACKRCVEQRGELPHRMHERSSLRSALHEGEGGREPQDAADEH